MLTIDYLGIFLIALLGGFCAYWNHRRGYIVGTQTCLYFLHKNNVIMIENNRIVPYRNVIKASTAKKERKDLTTAR